MQMLKTACSKGRDFGSMISSQKSPSCSMRILLVHNEYGELSGEETAVNGIHSLLLRNGHEVVPFIRKSSEIPEMPFGRARAFFNGVYSPASRRAIRRAIQETTPDLVHVHNLFPLISPSVLPECKQLGLPVVMTVHNYRQVCPNGLLFRNGRLCHGCLGGHEWRCVKNNCERSFCKSLGYSLRTWTARKRRWFLDNVDLFICLTEFQRRVLIREGFSQHRLTVIPNSTGDLYCGSASSRNPNDSIYVLYVGRVSPEKDVQTLLEAARRLPGIPVRIAGSWHRMPELVGAAPANVDFLGQLDGAALADQYHRCRMVVFATRCYEGCPTVLLEAMSHAKPVVCSRIGGLPEIVQEGRTGLLYTPQSPEDMAAKIEELWNSPELCEQLGRAARKEALLTYSVQRQYDAIHEAYRRAMAGALSANG